METYNILNKINDSWNEFINENIEEINNILSQIDFDNEIIFPKKENIFRSLF